MIKTKMEYKVLTTPSGYAGPDQSHKVFDCKLTLLAMDGWYLTSPVIYHDGFKGILAREVKVTRDNVADMILADWKSIGGNQEDFITVTSRRYDMSRLEVGAVIRYPSDTEVI